ncbi:MAG: hypothetical protein H6Q73_2426 [Firmicutes bacterium]|nr:hypothetical protein [Bacillota bacterium]
MRRITSIVLLVTFLLVSITGLQMALYHGGGKPPAIEKSAVNNSVDTSVPARPAQSVYPKGVHELAGYIFIIAGLIHLGLNIKPMKAYFKIK